MESSLDKYLRDHCSLAHPALDWIDRQTHIRTNYPQMLSGRVQGQLLKTLVEISGARRIMEIGTFTGYSSVCMALGMPADGHLDALEINDELENLILEGWERAGISGMASLFIGDARETLGKLSAEGAVYDLAFIDANKREYCEYYELVLPLMKSGGLMIVDDVLWDGKVYEIPMPQDKQTQGVAAFNDLVARDSRVETVILPLRDGISLVRKK